MNKRLLKAPEFAQIMDITLARAYEVLRQNPDLVVKLGERQIRVDPTKLDDWIKRGGCVQAGDNGE